MAYFTSVQSSLCCDVISRFRDDINCLFNDSKMILQLQTLYDRIVSEVDGLKDEFIQSLNQIPEVKMSNSDEEISFHDLDEFSLLIKLAWKRANEIIEKNAKNSRFLSCRGTHAASYAEKLIILMDFIFKHYYQDFAHQECAKNFTNLNKQLRLLLAPELLKGDELEAGLAFTRSAIPCIINLMSLIDIFNYTPRYKDSRIFYQEVIIGRTDEYKTNFDSTEMKTSKIITDFLTGDHLIDTKPIIDGRIDRLYIMADEIGTYIVKNSTSIKPPYSYQFVSGGHRPGCLDPMFYEMLPPFIRDRAIPRGRGRPKRLSRFMGNVGTEGANSDLVPIRLPSLHLPVVPFDY